MIRIVILLCITIATLSARERWTPEQAWAWHKTQPWLVGANFIPSTAINQLEMFQADTFDPATIDRELGYAESLGFTSMRVFLHDLLWLQDSDGFLKRLDHTLEIAAKHRIGLVLVLFDSCWHPLPKLGQQPAPVPRVHNSGWLQSPGVDVLRDPSKQTHLEPYVRGVITRFKVDRRVQAWDIWNEPANRDGQQHNRPGTEMEPMEKERAITALLPQVFRWARECDPAQPLTTAPWRPIGKDGALHPLEQLQVELSDVVSFHCYAKADGFRSVAATFAKFGRPLLCTEFMARPQSTFDPILGLMKERNIGGHCWGFVAGKIQTQFSLRWDPAKTPDDPPLWLNDVLRADGTPFSQKEADYIRSITAVASPERLRVSDNGHFFVTEEGAPVFVLADTAWSLVNRLKRADITAYLEHRRRQGFNAVAFVLFSVGNGDLSGSANAYGREPFARVNGRSDPTQPLLTPGAEPADDAAYDYWDHVDFAVAETKRLGLYAFILPCWGSATAGDIRTGKPLPVTVFDTDNARAYGRWLGARYKDEPHLFWMLGGDRSAVYENTGMDHRPVFHAMGEGLRAGDARALISYHPQKAGKQSGDWFHDAPWLAFNSIQLWPEAQLATITRDWKAVPAKPTWIFEGRYEAYFKNNYKPEQWGEWQCRQQAWQTVFAGAFGHTYGHERVFGFGKDGWDWRKELDAPGARSMTHLAAFMRSLPPAVALNRVPDQSLIAGDEGKAERLKSDRITASRAADGTHTMFYIANGRAFRARLEKLRGPSLEAHWFNPRTGETTNIGKVETTAEHEFTPPSSGDNNDWVLTLGRN